VGWGLKQIWSNDDHLESDSRTQRMDNFPEDKCGAYPGNPTDKPDQKKIGWEDYGWSYFRELIFR